MKKIKHYMLFAALIVTSLCLLQSNVYACCTVCFGSNRDNCYEFESSCNSICCGCSCVNSIAIHNNSRTDYILAPQGQPAYIINGTTKIKIASDKMAAFMKTMNAKYPSSKQDDPKIRKEISEAWDGFFKNTDNGSVSAKRLSIFGKETGLKVRTRISDHK